MPCARAVRHPCDAGGAVVIPAPWLGEVLAMARRLAEIQAESGVSVHVDRTGVSLFTHAGQRVEISGMRQPDGVSTLDEGCVVETWLNVRNTGVNVTAFVDPNPPAPPADVDTPF